MGNKNMNVAGNSAVDLYFLRMKCRGILLKKMWFDSDAWIDEALFWYDNETMADTNYNIFIVLIEKGEWWCK